MKKYSIWVVFTLLIGLFAPIRGQAASFTDVSTGYSFHNEIVYLTSEGVITGHKDGTFKPEDAVTRAQAAIMIGRALGLNGEQRATTFHDVGSSSVASGYIASAVERGIITGFPDGSYRPNQSVTRGQMAIFIKRAFQLVQGNTVKFTDISPSMAAYEAILDVTASGIASGYPDRTYRPDKPVTRGQFSAFMARTLEPSFRTSSQKGEMIVRFLDVGQGDAIFIEYPNGKTTLIDAGRYDWAIDTALKALSISHIDTFIATHPDADHIGGAAKVIKDYGVKKVIDNGQAHTTQTYSNYLKAIDTSGAVYVVAKIGDNVSEDPQVKADVLSVDSNSSDLNDGSIVMMLSYGLTDFLLTGDAGLNVEDYLMSHYDLDAEVLKVSHHGSDTGTGGDFIEAVSPYDAILSYGENSYGHPSSEVVHDLLLYGVSLFSTFEQGTITAETNGDTYTINHSPWEQGDEPEPEPEPEPIETGFANCTELRKVYPNGVNRSHPAYQSKFDRDNDGMACEG